MYLLHQNHFLEHLGIFQSTLVVASSTHTTRTPAMNTTLHILWGREAVSRYKIGHIDAHVLLGYNSYDFQTPDLSDAFLRGVREARDPLEWILVTQMSDVRKMGLPLRSRLIEAVRRGDLTMVKNMLKAGAKLDAPDEKGLFALHHAAQAGQSEVIHALVDAGADLEAVTANGSGKTALHCASESDRPGTSLAVTTLLKLGSDPSCRDASGNTSLHKAALSEDNNPGSMNEKAMALAKAGTDPRVENNKGHTALALAAVALIGSPAMLDRFVQILMDQERVCEASDLARLATVKRMAPGTRQDLIRPNGLS